MKYTSQNCYIVNESPDDYMYIVQPYIQSSSFNRQVWFAFCRAMLCISMTYAVTRCLSICLSVTFVSCIKTNKDIFKIFSASGSQAILVFPCQTALRDGDIPTGTPLTGVSNACGVGKKRDSGPSIWLRCIQVYSVVNRTSREVWKIKPRRTAASVEQSTHGGVRCSHKMTTKCSWRARRYTPETEVKRPDTTPLVITPFSAVVGHRRTEPGGYFCWKLTLPVLLTLSDPRLGVLTPTDPRTAENKWVMT